MVTKKTPLELSQMTLTEISKHIDDITQTEICKDGKYCSELIKEFLKK